MFARADKNGDGKLSKEEWHRVLNSAGCRTSMWGYQHFGDVDDDVNVDDDVYDGVIDVDAGGSRTSMSDKNNILMKK